MDEFLQKDTKLREQLAKKSQEMRSESILDHPMSGSKQTETLYTGSTVRDARAKQREARNAPLTKEFSPGRNSVRVSHLLPVL